MKEEDLKIDRTCHAIYTKQCADAIKESIKQHYDPSQVDEIFEQVQCQYEKYLAEFSRRDLGGSKNYHNHMGGTYDCIMFVCYYVVCKDKVTFKEIQSIYENLAVNQYKKLNFVDIDKPFWKHLMHFAFVMAAKKSSKWNDFVMQVDPYSKDKPLHYSFTSCPFADFIHQFSLEDIAGALCNCDYASMDAMNVKLVRKHTLIESDHCDYTFYSPNDPRLLEHEEYVDEHGFIRNK